MGLEAQKICDFLYGNHCADPFGIKSKALIAWFQGNKFMFEVRRQQGSSSLQQSSGAHLDLSLLNHRLDIRAWLWWRKQS